MQVTITLDLTQHQVKAITYAMGATEVIDLPACKLFFLESLLEQLHTVTSTYEDARTNVSVPSTLNPTVNPYRSSLDTA